MRRDEVGAFFLLFEDLRNDGDMFFNNFRMNIQTFDDINVRIRNAI